MYIKTLINRQFTVSYDEQRYLHSNQQYCSIFVTVQKPVAVNEYELAGFKNLRKCCLFIAI